jgi:hypothetical protein
MDAVVAVLHCVFCFRRTKRGVGAKRRRRRTQYRTQPCSLLVLGQPKQQRHGQQRQTVRASQTSPTILNGRQKTSLKQPIFEAEACGRGGGGWCFLSLSFFSVTDERVCVRLGGARGVLVDVVLLVMLLWIGLCWFGARELSICGAAPLDEKREGGGVKSVTGPSFLPRSDEGKQINSHRSPQASSCACSASCCTAPRTSRDKATTSP